MRPICDCGPVYGLPLLPYPVPSHSLSLVRLLTIGLRAIRAVPPCLFAHPTRRGGAWRAAISCVRWRRRTPCDVIVRSPPARSASRPLVLSCCCFVPCLSSLIRYGRRDEDGFLYHAPFRFALRSFDTRRRGVGRWHHPVCGVCGIPGLRSFSPLIRQGGTGR